MNIFYKCIRYLVYGETFSFFVYFKKNKFNVYNVQLNALQQLNIMYMLNNFPESENSLRLIYREARIPLKLKKIDLKKSFNYLHLLEINFTSIKNDKDFDFFFNKEEVITTGSAKEDEINEKMNLGIHVAKWSQLGLLEKFSLNGLLLLERNNIRKEIKKDYCNFLSNKILTLLNISKHDENVYSQILNLIKSLEMDYETALGHDIEIISEDEILNSRRN